jgi:hypothetical protein
MMSPEKLLHAIGHARWSVAEDAAVELLHNGGFREVRDCWIAAVLLAHTRVLGRLDVRGALTLMLPVISELGKGRLDARWSAHAHVVAAFVFAAPGSVARDRARLGLGLALASEVFPEIEGGELRALAALASLGAGVDLPSSSLALRHYRELSADLALAESPVAQVLHAEVRGAMALADAAAGAHRELEHALELACDIGYDAAEARITLALAEISGGQERARLLAASRAAVSRGAIDARWLSLRIDAAERGAV